MGVKRDTMKNKITKEYLDKLFGIEVIIERTYYNFTKGCSIAEKARGIVIYIGHHNNDDAGNPFARYGVTVPTGVKGYLKTEIRLDNGMSFEIGEKNDSITKIYPASGMGKALFED